MNRIKSVSRLRGRVSKSVASGVRQQRSGLTMAELIVSAVLLMTVMSFVTSLCFRINLIWSDVNHHRVAVSELSNHLEELTLMTLDEATTAIKSLEPSADCCRALDSPILSGEIVEDKLGSQVVLRINWDRPVAGNPTELAGWIVSISENDKEDPAFENEPAGNGGTESEGGQ